MKQEYRDLVPNEDTIQEGDEYKCDGGFWEPAPKERIGKRLERYHLPYRRPIASATPHPHYKKMAEYAKDAAETDKPWERWEFYFDETWLECRCHPAWDVTTSYRRKPRTKNINGYEVPYPVSEPLEVGQEYWVVYLTEYKGCIKMIWTDTDVDKECLSYNVCHLTESAAKVHAEALMSFFKEGGEA